MISIDHSLFKDNEGEKCDLRLNRAGRLPEGGIFMRNVHKMLGRPIPLLTIAIIAVFFAALFATAAIAATPTGPFTLEYAASDNGYINGDTFQIVELGDDGSSVEAVPYYGYHFDAWSDNSIDNPRTDFSVAGDVNVTAYFAKNLYAVNYYAGSGGTISGNQNQLVEYDTNSEPVTAVADPGYCFDSWSDGSIDNPRTDYWVCEDFDVTAYFVVRPITLDYWSEGNGYLEGETLQTVDYGDDGTAVTAVPDKGYYFVGWSDGSTDNPRTDLAVTDDLAVAAQFALIRLTLQYDAGANGYLTGETTQWVDYEGDGSAVTAVADSGYQFVGWSDGSTDNPRFDCFVSEDISVTANFSYLYTVTFDTQGGSAIANQMVVSGGKVKYPVAPSKTGLFFAGWYKEAACTNIWHSNIDLISGNTTLYAKWNDTAPKVLVLAGDHMGADVQDKLVATGLFSQVDLVSLVGQSPSLALLKQYHAVLFYTNSSALSDPVAWGDTLADYADGGGGVVIAAFSFVVPGGSMGIDGRFSSGDYLPFTQNAQGGDYYLSIVHEVAADPILNGVNTFNGGPSSHFCKVSLKSDATLIASWSNGYPLVATIQPTTGRIVGLNFFPVSSDVSDYYWDASTDGALLMANSLIWAASTGDTLAPPTITSGDGDTATVYVEENQTHVMTITATDPDSTTLTYSISGGFDANLFAIDSETGVLVFKTAPDYESPADWTRSNTYLLIVRVSDGELYDTQEISVIVTNAANEAPVIISDDGGSSADIGAKEKQTAVTVVTANDDDNDDLTFSISGGADADLFAIDPVTGVLTFRTAPDYGINADANADGIYEVIVEVSDGSLTDSQLIRVTVIRQTPVDQLESLIADIIQLQNDGIISKSTANGLIRTVDKAIAKVNSGDVAGAIKLLDSLKTTIIRQTPKKIPLAASDALVTKIDQIILELKN
jgi:uncharacterized repeat protein (TIGR02543 family)